MVIVVTRKNKEKEELGKHVEEWEKEMRTLYCQFQLARPLVLQFPDED